MTILNSPLPLALSDWQSLQQLLQKLDAGQLLWLSGYVSGLANARPGLNGGGHQSNSAPTASSRPAGLVSAPIQATVLYASHTGNGKAIAAQLVQELKADGVEARLLSVRDYPLRELKDERVLYAVISTHGDGEPPEDARDLFKLLNGKRAPDLQHLQFAVLALGDSSYPQYCAAGQQLAALLTAQGAQALFERIDADVDFKDPAAQFRRAANASSKRLRAAQTPVINASDANTRADNASELSELIHEAKAFNRDTPFAAPVIVNQRITAVNASKDVRHIELDLSGSNLSYQAGDALGIWPQNSLDLVDKILQRTQVAATADSHLPGLGWHQALQQKLEITQLSLPVLKRYSELALRSGGPISDGNVRIAELLRPDNRAALSDFLRSHQLLDLLEQFGVPNDSAQFLRSLRALTPRLYSIASSMTEVGDEAHISVGVRDYQAFGTQHLGAASGWLATRSEAETVPLFIQDNEHFRLPADSSRHLIMIGAGTGIAPYRAFLQERKQNGGSGKNWLIFGEQKRRETFLYQTELLAWHKQGLLNAIDVAFSRDGERKVYVQDRVREQGKQLWAQMQDGAQLYICGDATGMAPSVLKTLHEIAVNVGGLSVEAAEDYWLQAQRERRLQKDVY